MLLGILLGVSGPVRSLGAQPPATPRDTMRTDSARADTAGRRVPRDSAARADSARRAAISDSTQRDSVIARQLLAARERGEPVTRFRIDRLRLSAVGASAGLAAPDEVRVTPLYSVWADYGEVAREFRVVFGLMFWTSEFRRTAVDEFARAIGEVAGSDTVRLGRVRASDVVLHADLRWRPRIIRGRRTPGAVRPWVGAGVGVHLLDVQGAPISGTFVERALDGVATGGAASLGVDLVLTPSVQLTTQGRYDLFSGAHFASGRVGMSYIFDQRGR